MIVEADERPDPAMDDERWYYRPTDFGQRSPAGPKFVASRSDGFGGPKKRLIPKAQHLKFVGLIGEKMLRAQKSFNCCCWRTRRNFAANTART